MPWPSLPGRAKARSGSTGDGDLASDVNVGGLSLDEPVRHEQAQESRRAASMDIDRGPGFTSMSTADENDFSTKRARRSSFPRLALMSAWRSPALAAETQEQHNTSSAPFYRQNGSGSPSVGSRSSFSSISRSPSLLSRRSVAFSAKKTDDADDLELNGFELQEGHATPYTASGLKGGFQCIEPTLTGASGSSSAASSSRRSGSSALFSVFKGSTTTQGSDAFSMTSADTALSDRDQSVLSPVVSPIRMNGAIPSSIEAKDSTERRLRPTDSGFEEFGPDTVIQTEEDRSRERKRADVPPQTDAQRPSTAVRSDKDASSPSRPSTKKDNKGTRSRSTSTSIFSSNSTKQAPSSTTGSGDGAEDSGSNLSIPKKARARGWFSFNSSSNNIKADLAATNGGSGTSEDNASTPRQERGNPYAAVNARYGPESTSTTSASEGVPALEGRRASQTPARTDDAQAPSTTKKPKPTKQSASSKGISIIKSAGRKRGDSEVSMKEMSTISAQQ